MTGRRPVPRRARSLPATAHVQRLGALRRSGSTRRRRRPRRHPPAAPHARRPGRTPCLSRLESPAARRRRRRAPRAAPPARRTARAARGRSRPPRPAAPAARSDRRSPSDSADRGAEGVGGADQRPDVPGVGHVPERERDRPLLERRQVAAPVDADHARRVRHRRDPGEQLRLDVLAGDEQVDRLDPSGAGRVDEILALADEQAELVPLPPALQLADQLQARVGGGGDHARNTEAGLGPVRPGLEPAGRLSPGRRSCRTRPGR